MSTTRKRRKMGRPTKYTPEAGARIVGAMQVGAPLETAAGSAGVVRDTVRRWLKEGARMQPRRGPMPTDSEGRPILRTLGDFSAAVTRAFETVEVKCLNAIMGADDWRAKSWLLMNRHPDRYALPARRIVHEGGTTNTNVNVAAKVGEEDVVDLAQLSDEELDALDTLTAKAIGRAQPKPGPAKGKPDGSA